jgi:NAD(P)H-quinone oxidoreductase subunit 5
MDYFSISVHLPGSAPSLAAQGPLVVLLVQALATALLTRLEGAWNALQASLLALTVGGFSIVWLLGSDHAAVRMAADGFATDNAVSIGLWLDRLSAAMLCLTSAIGLVVLRFARRYLASEANALLFVRRMATGLLFIQLFVLSSSLVGVGLAWLALSVVVHRLLRHYENRFAARLGAKKKFLTSRLGDLAFWTALVVLFSEFGTLDVAELLAMVASPAADSSSLQLAAVLLVAAALVKSAQFPLHSWLPDTMDAPTPVSAWMHAGVVNAGAFLLLRTTPLLQQAQTALLVLVVVGGISACFGTLLGAVQNNLKTRLGWSTTAQMGFLFLELGLGLTEAAALHLGAHAAYKAHAFLWSGTPAPTPRPRAFPVRHLVTLVAGSLGAVALVAWALSGGFDPQQWKYTPLAAIWALGLLHYVVAPKGSSLAHRIAAALLVGGGLWLATLSIEQLLSGWFAPLPTPLASGTVGTVATLSIVLLFAATWTLCAHQRWTSPALRKLYVHAQSAFYLGELHDQLTLALWPEQHRASHPQNELRTAT